MKTDTLCAAFAALFLVSACSEAPTVPGAPSQAQQPSAETALVGVWQGSLGGGDMPMFFVLQPEGAAYFANLWEGGLTRGQWRIEGERILIGAEFSDQAITFTGTPAGDRIEGSAPGPDGGDLRFAVDRMGVWASVNAPNAAAGVWAMDMRNTEDGESGRCGLILQPDNRAFVTCMSALMTGLWTARVDGLEVDVQRRGEGGGVDALNFTGSLSGQMLTGAWTYEHGGGTFTATRAP